MKKIILSALVVLAPVWVWAIAPEDYYNAGMDLFKGRDYEKAVQYFKAAVDERPDYWQAYQFLGEAYYQNSNRTEAVLAMEQSLKLHPDNPDLRKFISKIRSDSPWASKGPATGLMPVIAILLSLVNLGWMAYRTWGYKLRPSHTPSKP